MIVEHAVYENGARVNANANGDGIEWLDLRDPTDAELEELARRFDLHELALEDAIHAYQRPKLERYGDTLFLVLRPARYHDETETVEFGELHVFAGPRFVVTIRRDAAADLGTLRRELEARPDLLRRVPLSIVHAVVDHVVDGYVPVVAGVENDVDEIETALFSHETDVSKRTYELIREVIEFRRATHPLPDMLERLMHDPTVDEEEQAYLRDVQDHAIRVQERVDAFDELLRNILNVNLTLETKALSEAGNRQNEDTKKISAWAAILFAPTLVGTVYGMNFEHMPELDWRLGYPFALGLMLGVSVTLYVVFKRRGWI